MSGHIKTYKGPQNHFRPQTYNLQSNVEGKKKKKLIKRSVISLYHTTLKALSSNPQELCNAWECGTYAHFFFP